ncbi:MAG: type 4a pilus biogenesis protein PilO [Candidatus Sulfotelmatobacter sp.]
MPDLRQTRKSIKIALTALVAVDVVAVIVLLSPLVGSTESRRVELNQLWGELQMKTRQVEPLTNLPAKVSTANQQIADFYKKRFPGQESQLLTQFGKLAVSNGVAIERVSYKVKDEETGSLQPVEMNADLSGSYVSLAQFINALERDDMLFIISSITLAGEHNGPIRLQMKLETYLKAGA